MLPDPQEVASNIAARIRQREKIKKHRNIYIVLAVLFWILFATFMTLMILAFLAESGNVHKWAFLFCFIIVFILGMISTLLVISLQSDGERFSTIYNWYFQCVFNQAEIPIGRFENISTLNNESRLSSASTVAVEDIRFQEIRNNLVNDLRRQFSLNENPLEPAIPNIERERPPQEAVDINISCSQPNSSGEDISSTFSSNLVSAVSSDRTLSGPCLLERQASTLSEISELTADSQDIDVCTSLECPENVQQQSSAIEGHKPDVVLPEQDSEVRSQETMF